MMKRMLVALVVPMLIASAAFAADIKLDGINCIVAGSKAAKTECASEYKGGKVFFCCGNCKKGFDGDSAKHSTKANQQLVATGQAKQAKCPLSGAPCKPDKVVSVGGSKVYFCCENCQGKVAEAKGDAQAELVFSDKAFEKGGFKVGK